MEELRKNPKREEFKLRLMGVGIGKHSFSIVCDDTFFELAGIEAGQESQILLDIEMHKKETFITFSFNFNGKIVLPCDRCLDPVDILLTFKNELMVQYSSMIQQLNTEDDDLWTISENEFEIDIFHFVYESILLAIPIKIAHPEDEKTGCNPEIIEKLKEISLSEEAIDPRWETLKNINIENN
ncbi:MAG: DUF177 domain-containing protein [Bacteroidales bacterium]|jgi:uncharacterized metal-binding protein YceD (DUF177 family)|nr:DUF177 domain-containing protein [Bacteroidales bacterium]